VLADLTCSPESVNAAQGVASTGAFRAAPRSASPAKITGPRRSSGCGVGGDSGCGVIWGRRPRGRWREEGGVKSGYALLEYAAGV